MPDPIAKVRQGPLGVAVFAQVGKNDKPYRSVVLQNGYQDAKTKKWINYKVSFFDNQIASVVSLLTSIKEQLAVLDKKD